MFPPTHTKKKAAMQVNTSSSAQIFVNHDQAILTDGAVAIRRLIACEAEAESEYRNRDAIRNAGCLLLELEDLSAGGRICHDSHAVFATGIAAVSRLIALQLAQAAPDLDAIEHASWLIADLADLVDDELGRGVQ